MHPSVLDLCLHFIFHMCTQVNCYSSRSFFFTFRCFVLALGSSLCFTLIWSFYNIGTTKIICFVFFFSAGGVWGVFGLWWLQQTLPLQDQGSRLCSLGKQILLLKWCNIFKILAHTGTLWDWDWCHKMEKNHYIIALLLY